MIKCFFVSEAIIKQILNENRGQESFAFCQDSKFHYLHVLGPVVGREKQRHTLLSAGTCTEK